jgi:hypothetical protein
MYPTMRARFALAVVAVAFVCSTSPVHSQAGSNWKALAVYTVMDYRATVLADTAAKFDRCRVTALIGSQPPSVPPQVAADVEAMLGPCDSAEGRLHTSIALIHSVTLEQAAVRVDVTVRHGEWSHVERYEMVPRGPDRYMVVREVRLTGGAQFYSPGGTRGQSPPIPQPARLHTDNVVQQPPPRARASGRAGVGC